MQIAKLTVDSIAATAPVSPGEERQLIDMMIAGRRAEEWLRHNPGDADRAWLAADIEAGQSARRRLIEANGRLAIHLAAKYHRNQTQIPLAELCQEGVLGLMRGIDKFDPMRETKLSTYATWWIRQAVSRYLNQQRIIRLPVHQVDRLYRMRRARAELAAKSGKNPDSVEIAAHVGDTPENIELLRMFEPGLLSLDEPVGEDEFSRHDFLPGNGPQPEIEATNHLQREQVRSGSHPLFTQSAEEFEMNHAQIVDHKILRLFVYFLFICVFDKDFPIGGSGHPCLNCQKHGGNGRGTFQRPASHHGRVDNAGQHHIFILF